MNGTEGEKEIRYGFGWYNTGKNMRKCSVSCLGNSQQIDCLSTVVANLQQMVHDIEANNNSRTDVLFQKNGTTM